MNMFRWLLRCENLAFRSRIDRYTLDIFSMRAFFFFISFSEFRDFSICLVQKLKVYLAALNIDNKKEKYLAPKINSSKNSSRDLHFRKLVSCHYDLTFWYLWSTWNKNLKNTYLLLYITLFRHAKFWSF